MQTRLMRWATTFIFLCTFTAFAESEDTAALAEPTSQATLAPEAKPTEETPRTESVPPTGNSVDQSPVAYFVRITSVNGEKRVSDTVPVSVGDTVTLGADLFKKGGDCSEPEGCPLQRVIEEFRWKASNREGNVCHPREQKDCLVASNFQLNDFGVSFYVPEDMGASLRVTVSHEEATSADEISLIAGAAPPIAVSARPVPTPSSKTAEIAPLVATVFHYDRALLGMGRWVYVGGGRYWVPYLYQAQWAPYQQGHWAWVEGDGWTWISYDPWGHLTDHYGVWRHHGVYGWMWMPFTKHVYRPAVVTWMTSPSHIAWFPYLGNEPGLYRHGVEHGFNDGWGATAHPFALTVVKNTDFTAKNIDGVKLPEKHIKPALFPVGAAPVPQAHLGSESLADSKKWVELRAKAKVPSTEKKQVEGEGGLYHEVQSVHPIPDRYGKIMLGLAERASTPVGSLVSRSAGKTTVIPPIKNGKSLAHPPRAANGQIADRPRTKAPSQPRKDHPYAKRVKAKSRIVKPWRKMPEK